MSEPRDRAFEHQLAESEKAEQRENAPFIVQEQIGLPGDRIVYSAIDPSTGITTGAYDRREQAEHDAKALNAAYELGRNHESHDAGRVVQAARKVHECRQDDACNDAPHSCHVDLNAAIELADAIEQYDTYHENRSPMILDTEPRRLTDDELGGRMTQSTQTAFGGDPIWPKGTTPYRAEFSLSCGWVIVDPDGRESTLGYARRDQADDVAAKMSEAYWAGRKSRELDDAAVAERVERE